MCRFSVPAHLAFSSPPSRIFSGGIQNKTLTYERAWTCPSCGARHDRDLNAALNIMSRYLEAAAVRRGMKGRRVMQSADGGNLRVRSSGENLQFSFSSPEVKAPPARDVAHFYKHAVQPLSEMDPFDPILVRPCSPCNVVFMDKLVVDPYLY
jgi:hypothetical protein